MEQLLHFLRQVLREELSLLSAGEVPASTNRSRQLSSSILEVSTALGDYTLKGSKRLGVVSAHNSSYSALLARKSIFTHLKLLLSSAAIMEEVNFAYRECKNICMAVRDFNVNHSLRSHPQGHGRRSLQYLSANKYLGRNKRNIFKKINYGDIMEVFIRTRSKVITSALMRDCCAESTLRLAELENSFIMAFIGIVAAFSCTLDSHNNNFSSSFYDDVYSSQLSLPTSGWKSFVLTGQAASELKPLWKSTFCRLWSLVAGNLSSYGCSLLHMGQTLEKFQSVLASTWCYLGLEFHPEVQSCLRQVTLHLLVQDNLHKWDQALQQVMVMNHKLQHKGYREVIPPISKGQILLEVDVYEDIQKDFSEKIEAVHVSMDKPSSIVLHVQLVKQTLILCSFLQVVIGYLTLELLQCVRRNVYRWDLPNLAWLLTSGVPRLVASVKKCVSVMQFVSCPRLAFPASCTVHRLEKHSKNINEDIFHSFTNLQEVAENFYAVFYEQWRDRCTGIIQSNFPSAKIFRKAVKKQENFASQYCDKVIEVIFSPVVEAAQMLPDEAHQKNFVYLLLTIFYSIFRKTIISTNKIYLEPCITEQLLVDIDYLQSWSVSPERGWGSSVGSLIRHLPIVAEMRAGLQKATGQSYDETDAPNQTVQLEGIPSFHQYFPVFVDISWNSDKDWIK